MSDRVWTEQCYNAGVDGGGEPATREVIVATEVRHPNGTVTRCRAAPLLRGVLHRRGLATRTAAVHMPARPVGSGQVTALVATAGHHDAPSTVLAAAVRPGDDVTAAAVMAGLAAITPAMRDRTVLVASPRSFCAGVDRAIEIVERLLRRDAGPVFVRKEIVHNSHVVADLRRRGAIFVNELDAVPDGATVVFSAHGVPPAVRAEADRRGLDVIDATCPLVTKVHAEARRFAGRGDTVVLIGHIGHEEVEGTVGEAPAATVVVGSAEEAARVHVADPTRVSYLAQTTLAVDETQGVVDALRRRFPAIRGPASDDICYATTNRQRALSVVCDEADLLLVVGSPNSSNTQRLVELAQRRQRRAYLVDRIEDVDPAWLADAGTVGLTAGASAPPRLVDEVIDALAGLGPIAVHERKITTETVSFALPRKARG